MTTIEWTDETWNPTGGCDRISPGCAHCYAKEQWDRRHKAVLAGKTMAPQYAQPFEVLQLFPDRLLQPFKWRKPQRVFVNSMSDLFHEDVPDAFIDRVFAVMAARSVHTFQILTKRADRMLAYMRDPLRHESVIEAWSRTLPRRANRTTIEHWPLPNVWLGVSVENQHFADERIPLLLQTPAVCRFISAEPLLGPVELRFPYANLATDGHIIHGADGLFVNALKGVGGSPPIPPLDWIIVGGESGSGARSFDLAWARSIVQQCKVAGVPVFIKQLGSNPVEYGCTSRWKQTDRKGGDFDFLPVELQVRQFPEARP